MNKCCVPKLSYEKVNTQTLKQLKLISFVEFTMMGKLKIRNKT